MAKFMRGDQVSTRTLQLDCGTYPGSFINLSYSRLASCRMGMSGSASFQSAKKSSYGLRALDSYHLAAALVWCKEQPRGRLFVCCDVRLAEVATKAGVDVLP
ncbi:MAG: hypothetical protein ACREBG_14000 [Pyrinomonadaceae bacterium]